MSDKKKITDEEKLAALKAKRDLINSDLDFHQVEMVRLTKELESQNRISIEVIKRLVQVNTKIAKLERQSK